MSPRALVIFDLDGTILDTLPDLGEAVNYALRRRGLPEHTLSEYRDMVGEGIRKLCARALGGEDDPRLGESLKDFKSYYVSHIDVHTRPYEGMPELIEDLQKAGAAVAVASNKFRSGAVSLCRRFYPSIPSEWVMGDEAGLRLKPAPDMLEALSKMFPSGTPVVMVGDAWTDIEAGKAFGCKTLGVSWGYRYTEALYRAGADEVVDTVGQLEQRLKQFLNPAS